jgi:hypothetical protein
MDRHVIYVDVKKEALLSVWVKRKMGKNEFYLNV